MTRPTIVIAGAGGFIGRALASQLAQQYRVIGLSRNPPRTPDSAIEWRQCDLFTLQQCEAALQGADQAVYLVHSMLPSARLTQGDFQDMDLIIADNFARAAKKAGVRHIVYLGGLVPGDKELSEHLRSRLEVEQTLSSRGVPVTALRAGIVLGSAGSSFNILIRLVRRLPVIPLPKWTRSLTQPVALRDVIQLLQYSLEHPSQTSVAHDIGCREVMSYREMLERTAKLAGVSPRFIAMDQTSSTWWRYLLAWFVGAPKQLVLPLIESMRHSMIARDCSFQEAAGLPPTPFDDAVRDALQAADSTRWEGPFRRYWASLKTTERDVRSVQRMVLPPGRTALWAAMEYIVWLPMFFRTVIRAEVDADRNLRLGLRFPRITLLQLTYAADRSTKTDRQLFFVTGGVLARLDPLPNGARPRLEFREALDGKVLLAAIHDFRPTLPWFIYNATQALAHLLVMKRFAEHLRRVSRQSASAGNSTKS